MQGFISKQITKSDHGGGVNIFTTASSMNLSDQPQVRITPALHTQFMAGVFSISLRPPSPPNSNFKAAQNSAVTSKRGASARGQQSPYWRSVGKNSVFLNRWVTCLECGRTRTHRQSIRHLIYRGGFHRGLLFRRFEKSTQH